MTELDVMITWLFSYQASVSITAQAQGSY